MREVRAGDAGRSVAFQSESEIHGSPSTERDPGTGTGVLQCHLNAKNY